MKNFKYLMTFESYSILGRVETVIITNEQGETVTCDAKIDTGSYSSRISGDIAKKLKLPVVDQRKITSSMGEEYRTFVELQFNINGIEIKTCAGISNMCGLRNEVAIGRKDIEMVDGIVDVKKNNRKPIGIPLDTPVEVEIEVEPDVEPTIEPEIEIQLPVDESLNESTTIVIEEDEEDERSNRKSKDKSYNVTYTYELDGDTKEIEGKLKPYNSGRSIDYEFEPDYFTDEEVESFYDNNWEDIQEEILKEFYNK
jgi:hypothetical protein